MHGNDNVITKLKSNFKDAKLKVAWGHISSLRVLRDHMLLLSIILAIAEIEETDTTLSNHSIKHGM